MIRFHVTVLIDIKADVIKVNTRTRYLSGYFVDPERTITGVNRLYIKTKGNLLVQYVWGIIVHKTISWSYPPSDMETQIAIMKAWKHGSVVSSLVRFNSSAYTLHQS